MFRVGRIKPAQARSIIVKHHYSKAWPTGNFLSFGVFFNREIMGVVTYGHPANNQNWKSIPGLKKSRDMCELTRLWVADRAPDYLESRSIAATLRVLRQKSKFKCVISYSDPNQGHIGTVYQASNWIFLGKQSESTQLEFLSGRRLHKRAAFDKFGTDNAERLKSRFPGIRNIKVEGKLKYAYPLDRKLRKQIQHLSKPYPKRQPEKRGSGDHPGIGGAEPTLALQSTGGQP